MKLYITCPVCGAKLGKAVNIKELDIQCFKCREYLIININDTVVTVQKNDDIKKNS